MLPLWAAASWPGESRSRGNFFRRRSCKAIILSKGFQGCPSHSRVLQLQVLAHPQFKRDPISAVAEHLQATLPAPEIHNKKPHKNVSGSQKEKARRQRARVGGEMEFWCIPSWLFVLHAATSNYFAGCLSALPGAWVYMLWCQGLAHYYSSPCARIGESGISNFLNVPPWEIWLESYDTCKPDDM